MKDVERMPKEGISLVAPSCTSDDILNLLGMIEPEYLDRVKIILSQGSRNQNLAQPMVRVESML